MDKKWITLNVGGTHFTSSRSTLTKGTPPSSPLHRISINSTNVIYDRDEQGAYMIDRDPQYFQTILNFLRNKKLVLPPNVAVEAILLEAEHFNIPDLIRAIKNQQWERVGICKNGAGDRPVQAMSPIRGIGLSKPPSMDPATLAEIANELQQFAENL